ncbi:MAG: hypothetical protein U0165_17825 [Polyangiaceae bacterium]
MTARGSTVCVLTASVGVWLSAIHDASACGASCPIAVSGLSPEQEQALELPSTGAAQPPKPVDPPLLWRLRLSYWTLDTTLLFSGSAPDARIKHHSIAMSLEHTLSERWVLQLSAGSVLGGDMSAAGRSFDIKPGLVASAVGSYRWLDGRGYAPFLLLNVGLSALVSRTEEQNNAHERNSLSAFDIRVGATVGKTFFQVVSPYAAVRAFGGPTLWTWQGTSTYGGDHTHVQGAVGLSVAPHRRIDLYGEWAPLGEKRVAFGAGVAF